MRGLPNDSPLAYRRAARGLKACPLCRAVNALDNENCFVCGWHGEFDREPALVEAALAELLHRCPELAEAMQDEPPSPTLLARTRALIGSLKSRFSRYQGKSQAQASRRSDGPHTTS